MSMFHRNLPVGRRQPSSNSSHDTLEYDGEAPRSPRVSRLERKKSTTSFVLSFQRMAVRFRMLPAWMQIVFVGLFVAFSLYNVVETSSAIMHDLAIGNTGRQSTRQRKKGELKRNRQKHYDEINMPNKEIMPEIPKISADEWNKKLRNDRPHYENRPTFRSEQPRVVTVMEHAYRPIRNSPFISFEKVLTIDSTGADFTKNKERELDSGDVDLRFKQPKEIREADKLEVGDCKALAQWQKRNPQTCNIVHEASSGWQTAYDLPQDVKDQLRSKQTEVDNGKSDESSSTDHIESSHHREQIRYVNEGAFRQVWMIRDFDNAKRVMKTLVASSRKDFDKRNLDRHRRDALSFSELTTSDLIVDMYGYCTNTGLFDFADGGDLYDIFDKRPGVTKRELLHLAYNVTRSIHDAHHFDEMGRPTLAHTDIKPDQFLLHEGYYKLSDFNRVRFLTWNYKEDLQCGYRVGKNGGNYRSPEEYNYEIQTEKVDVYSMGNVLYFLLTQEDPWEGYKNKHVYELVKRGQRPKIPIQIYNSSGVFEQYMIKAMEMAWTHSYRQRPGALEISKVLKEGLDKLAAGQTILGKLNEK